MSKLPEHKHDVGPGWHPLLDQLHEELTVIHPDYQIGQVKEKFGDLRVYLDHYPKDIWEELNTLIWKYERMSSVICEDCGQPGKHTTDRFWIRTLCDKCARGGTEDTQG